VKEYDFRQEEGKKPEELYNNIEKMILKSGSRTVTPKETADYI
jgi:hypothetical protein